MMELALISVIIPVYNVEQYLSRCLDSVMQQTYRNIEILLIDDGSTDNSGNICDQYARKDNRFSVFHKKNGGLSDARNYALEICHGEFVTFIDSDDYVSKRFIEVLYETAQKSGAEIIVCNLLKFYGNNIDTRKNTRKEEGQGVYYYHNIEAISNMLYRKELTAYAPGKLYTANLFDTIRFPVNKLFEDLYTTYKLYYMASLIVYRDLDLYYYYQRPNSIVNSSFDIKKMEQLNACEEILLFIKNNSLPLNKAIESKILITSIDLYRRIDNKEKYKKEREKLLLNVRLCRMNVFKDKNNKLLIRIIAFICILSPGLLRIIGKFYTFLVNKKFIKPRRPI